MNARVLAATAFAIALALTPFVARADESTLDPVGNVLPTAAPMPTIGPIPTLGSPTSPTINGVATPAPQGTPAPQFTGNPAQVIANAQEVVNAPCTGSVAQKASTATGLDGILDQTTDPTKLLTRGQSGSAGSLSDTAYKIAGGFWIVCLLFSVVLWFTKSFRNPEQFFPMLMGIEGKFFGIAATMLVLQFAAGEGIFASNNAPAVQLTSTLATNISAKLAQSIIVPSDTSTTTTLADPRFKISTPGDAFRTGTCLAWKTWSGPWLASLSEMKPNKPTILQDITGLIDGVASANTNGAANIMSVIAALLNMAPFAILAFQLFLVKWAGIVFGAAAIILLGFSVFELTASWAEPYWKFVIGNAMSTLTITLVGYFIAALMDATQIRTFSEIASASQSSNFFSGLGQSIIAPFTGDMDMIFISLFCVGLALSTPSLTAIFTSGSGGLSGGNIFAVGAAATGALAGGLGALAKALTSVKKASDASNLLKDGADALQKSEAADSLLGRTPSSAKLPGVESEQPQEAPWNAEAPKSPSTSGKLENQSHAASRDAAPFDEEQPSDMDAIAEAARRAETGIDDIAELEEEAREMGEGIYATPVAAGGIDAPQDIEDIDEAVEESLARGQVPSRGRGAENLATMRDDLAGVADAASKVRSAIASGDASEVGTALAALDERLESFAATTGSISSELGEVAAGAASTQSQSIDVGDDAAAAAVTTMSMVDTAATGGAGGGPPAAPKRRKRSGSSGVGGGNPSPREIRSIKQTGIASSTIASTARSLAQAAPYAQGAAAAPFVKAATSLAAAADVLTTSGMQAASAQAISVAQSDVAAATVALAQTGTLPASVAEGLAASNEVLEFEAGQAASFVAQAAGGAPPSLHVNSAGAAGGAAPGTNIGSTAPPMSFGTPDTGAGSDSPTAPSDTFVTLMERAFTGLQTSMEAQTELQTSGMSELVKAARQQTRALQEIAKAGPLGAGTPRTASSQQQKDRKTFLELAASGFGGTSDALDQAKRLIHDHHHAANAPKTTGIHQ